MSQNEDEDVPTTEEELDDELDGDEDDDLAPQEPPRTFGSWIWEVAKTWGPAILAIIIIRTFVFQPFSIPSTSMVPTLLIGDHVIVTKFSYGLWLPDPLSYDRWEIADWADPKRGDIIVFRYPMNKSTHYIKRVVAVPGDRVEVVDNQLILNGEPQPRIKTGRYTYQDDCIAKTGTLWEESIGRMKHAKLTGPSRSPLANFSAVTVPEGKVFVMGDNRDNSGDSRTAQWTWVDEDIIMGRAQFIWISFASCDGSLTPNLRWDRMGMGLYGRIQPNVSPNTSGAEGQDPGGS